MRTYAVGNSNHRRPLSLASLRSWLEFNFAGMLFCMCSTSNIIQTSRLLFLRDPRDGVWWHYRVNSLTNQVTCMAIPNIRFELTVYSILLTVFCGVHPVQVIPIPAAEVENFNFPLFLSPNCFNIFLRKNVLFRWLIRPKVSCSGDRGCAGLRQAGRRSSQCLSFSAVSSLCPWCISPQR